MSRELLHYSKQIRHFLDHFEQYSILERNHFLQLLKDFLISKKLHVVENDFTHLNSSDLKEKLTLIAEKLEA